MGEADPNDLAAGDLAEVPVEQCRREPEALELGGCALLDVPGVTDDVEVGRIARPGVQPADRPPDLAYAEQIVDATGPVESEVLRQVAEGPGDLDRAALGCQQPGREAEERRLAGAVGADQAGAAGRDEEVETVEGDVAVRPRERYVGEGEDGG